MKFIKSTAESKTRGWILPALLLFFLAMRLTTLLSGGFHAFEAEELYRGVIAREILDGLKMPVLDYQADHYSGGSLLSGLAATPFFILFGPSLFSLKLSPLLFAFLTLVFLWIFMKRNFGTQAAVFASLFFILAPPSFMRLSLTAMGFHSESILFSILMLYFFFRYFFEAKDLRFLFCFAFLSGLGFWFTHITVLVPMTCLAAWFFLEPRTLFSRRILGVFFAGIFLGLLPWFAYNLTHDFEGMGFIASNLLHLGEGGGPGAFSFNFERLGSLLFTAVPASFAFERINGISRQFLCGTYAVLAAGLLAAVMTRAIKEKQRRLVPLLFLPVVFVLAYWLSSLEMTAVTEPEFFYLFFDDCRYFVPLHFSLMLLMGAACARGRLTKIPAALLLTLGAAGFCSVSFLEPWAQVSRMKGYSYSQLGALRGHIWPKISPGFEAHLKSLERYPSPDRFFVFWNSLYGLQFEKDLNPEKIKRLMDLIPAVYRPHTAQGIGYGMGARTDLVSPGREQAVQALLPEYHSFFYKGFVDAAMSGGPEQVQDFLKFAQTIPEENRDVFYFQLGHICPYERKKDAADFILKRPNGESDSNIRAFFRGIGVRCMVNWIFDGYVFEKAVENLGFEVPAEYQDDFNRGIGWGLCYQTAEDKARREVLLRGIPAGRKPQVASGLEECLKTYAVPNE